ncbi:MAG: hypothetical protein CM15mP59_4200 [Flavobacteriaceae bacterium]|nr:MAG: hypothetical protein CM15mP59_4200 [Flavobacteriaceae bacterium]
MNRNRSQSFTSKSLNRYHLQTGLMNSFSSMMGVRISGWDIINSFRKTDDRVSGIKFTRNFGKSQALHAGFERSQGEVVFTMDADLQDNPKELEAIYNKLKSENLDLVSGWKKVRHDPLFTKTIPSRFYNWTARLFQESLYMILTVALRHTERSCKIDSSPW